MCLLENNRGCNSGVTYVQYFLSDQYNIEWHRDLNLNTIYDSTYSKTDA